MKIKTGDIILLKNYNVFKRIWYRLCNKELPYNDAYLAICGSDVEILKPKQVKVLTLKKGYNIKEKCKLLQKIEIVRKPGSAFPILYLDATELRFVVNGVRPDTFKTGSISDILNSEYYKHV